MRASYRVLSPRHRILRVRSGISHLLFRNAIRLFPGLAYQQLLYFLIESGKCITVFEFCISLPSLVHTFILEIEQLLNVADLWIIMLDIKRICGIVLTDRCAIYQSYDKHF